MKTHGAQRSRTVALSVVDLSVAEILYGLSFVLFFLPSVAHFSATDGSIQENTPIHER